MYDVELTHLGIFLIAGLASPVAIKVLQYLLAPNIPRLRRATSTYECGEKPIGNAQVRYNTQFFTFAIIFVLFDIFTVMFLLWAYSFRLISDTTTFLIIMGLFASLILGGLFFWIKKGAVTWT